MTNKTKRLGKRALSLLVCFAMLCSLSLTSIALPQSTDSTALGAVTDTVMDTVKNTTALSAGNQTPLVTSDLAILCDGVEVQDVILPMDDEKDLSLSTNGLAVTDVQWQILVDRDQNQWANIQDATNRHFHLSYAVVMSALYDNDIASLRVSAKDEDGNLLVSESLLVKVTEAPEALPALTSEKTPMLALAEEPTLDVDPDTNYINIQINYLSADDPSRQVYAPYTASVLVTSSYSQNVLSPTQIGFAPYYIGTQGAPMPEDGDTITATHGGDERTYTYNAGAGTYIDNETSAPETDSDWLTAIESAIIQEAATVTADSIYVSYDYGISPVQNIVYNVYYVSIDVPYSVRYYFQNINDDEYTQNAAISFIGMAKTGTIVGDDTLEQPVYDYYGVEPGEDFGFSALYHYPESVAADGSTVFDYYFDRNYYIIKFDNNGGYGVEPIYARYDASFVVTPPVRPGYVFQGWDEITTYEFNVYANVNGVETQVGTQTLTAAQYVDLGSPSAYTRNYTAPNGTVYANATHRFVDSYGDGTADEGTSASHTFNGNIAARTVAYKALWSVTNTTATIVFWRENANDEEFSYWGSHPITAQSNTRINGEDYIGYLSSSISTNDTQYFTYLSADKDVLVEGDGSTVVNVYYARNRYTVLFKGLSTTCALDEHTHSDADGCYAYPLCDQHTHTADCYNCGKEEIPHTEECCSLVEHTHTADCLLECDKEEHTHTDACYSCGFPAGYQHTHTDACCAKEEHTHTNACCSVTVHTHTNACCDKPVHTHDGTSCNYLTCTKHVHSFSCYTSQNLSTTSGNITSYASQIQNPENGRIYRWRRNNSNYYNFFYFNDTWYYINTTNGNTTGSIGGISFTGTLSNPRNNNSFNSVTANVSCGQADHTHTAACYSCGKLEAPHTRACYTTQNLSTNNLDYTDEIDNPVNGTIYRYAHRGTFSMSTTYYNYFYVNDTWYYISNASGNTTGSIGGISFTGTLTNPGNNSYNSVTATTTCTTHHQHDASCCTLTAHSHGDGTCNLNNCPNGGKEHTHGDGKCVYDKCGKQEHTHTDGTCVYTKCGKQEHTHTAACIQCSKEEHTHSDACHYACGKVEHHHTNACCTKEEHTHSAACYTISGTYNGNALHLNTGSVVINNATATTVNGVTLYYDSTASTNNRYLYYKIGNQYYQLYYGTNTNNRITYNNRNTMQNLTITKTCTKSEHTHGDGACAYGCGLVEHSHNDFCYDCGLTVHTHGDGNCNANACSDPSHHEHTADCLTCGYEAEHVHTADCAKVLVCGKPEHAHSTNCNRSSTDNYHYGFVAKYEQNIAALWPTWRDYAASENKNDLITVKNGTTFSSFSYETSSSSYATKRVTLTSDMIDNTDKQMIATASFANSTKRTANYYFESFDQTNNGQTGHVQYSGTWYDLNDDYSQTYYSSSSSLSAKAITGMQTGTTASGGTNTTNLYYKRLSYTLDLCNYDNSVISGQSYDVKFEQTIDSAIDVANYVPPYPSTLEENAYEFVGWYTTEGRFPGSEYKPGMTMPAGPVALYAKWVPLTHHVRFFETYDDMLAYEASVAAGTPDESLVYVKPTAPDVEYSIETSHGSYIGSIPNPDKLRVTNPGGSTTEYDFGGWFFIQNGSKKAYTPLDMPVTRDLNVFADWGSHSAQPYVVHYALDTAETDTHFLNLLPRASLTYADLTQTVTYNDEARTYVCLNDGGTTYGWHRVIANDTMGYAYQGTTRTFTAKAGDPFNQLFEGFNVHFFPTVSSHSITVAFEESSVDPRINTFTFRYVQVPNVSYTVKYINSDTGAAMSEPKTVTTTSAVVTERFKVFSGFVPDAFYKQLVLAVAPDSEHPGQWISSPDNVITFYYSENTSSARYTIHFLLQKNGEEARTLTDADYAVSFAADGTYTFSDKFEESGSRVDGVSDKDISTQISPIDFAGYDLVSNKALEIRGQQNGTWAQNAPTYSGGKYTILPVMYGTDLFLFYQREEYAYKVYYLLYGTPVTPADLVNYTTVAADTETPKRVLADTASGTALYGSSYTATALDISGYTCVTNKTITKDITPSASNNYIVFFYTPLQYTVQYKVWKNGGGTVSNGNETFSDPSSLLGSTATASAGYTFAGWFVDPDCTIPATYNPTYNPQGMGTTYEDSTKTTPNTFGAYVFPNVACLTANGTEGFAGNIFYAKFNPEFGNLTVRRENSANQGMGTQVFLYEVKNNQTGEVVNITITGDGEVTIKDIAVGTYTVTQINDWSHRWVDAPKTATVTSTTPGLAVFSDSAVNDKWLNGNSPVAKNVKGATA